MAIYLPKFIQLFQRPFRSARLSGRNPDKHVEALVLSNSALNVEIKPLSRLTLTQSARGLLTKGDGVGFPEVGIMASGGGSGRMAYHLTLRSVADSNIAEEISQEALVRLYKHVGEIAGEGAFKTWFYRIVLNLVHDHFRRAVRQDAAKTTLEEIRTFESKSRN